MSIQQEIAILKKRIAVLTDELHTLESCANDDD